MVSIWAGLGLACVEQNSGNGKLWGKKSHRIPSEAMALHLWALY